MPLRQQSCLSQAVKDQDFTEKSEGFFPSFVGGSQKWGSFGIAYALMNLDARDISQNDKFTEISTEESGARTFHRTHQEDNKLVCGGVGIGSLISGGFALGASVFYYQRSIKASNHQMTSFNTNQIVMIGHKFETQNFGLYFIAGAMYRRKRWSLGISMKYGSSLKDSTQLTYDSIVADQSSDETKKAEVVYTATNLNSFKEKNPLTIRLGASSQLAKSLLITADIIYHSAVSDSGGDERFNLNSTLTSAEGSNRNWGQ